MRRAYSQIQPRQKNFVTVINTTWLYPEINVAAALATTTYKYTYDGDFITCPDIASIAGIYGDIFNSTVITLGQDPLTENLGYSIGIGTLLENLGKELRFRLTNGNVVIVWTLVKQLTPQNPARVIPVPGDSPDNAIGFVTTYLSYGRATISPYPLVFDDVNLVTTG